MSDSKHSAGHIRPPSRPQPSPWQTGQPVVFSYLSSFQSSHSSGHESAFRRSGHDRSCENHPTFRFIPGSEPPESASGRIWSLRKSGPLPQHPPGCITHTRTPLCKKAIVSAVGVPDSSACRAVSSDSLSRCASVSTVARSHPSGIINEVGHLAIKQAAHCNCLLNHNESPPHSGFPSLWGVIREKQGKKGVVAIRGGTKSTPPEYTQLYSRVLPRLFP